MISTISHPRGLCDPIAARKKKPAPPRIASNPASSTTIYRYFPHDRCGGTDQGRSRTSDPFSILPYHCQARPRTHLLRQDSHSSKTGRQGAAVLPGTTPASNTLGLVRPAHVRVRCPVDGALLSTVASFSLAKKTATPQNNVTSHFGRSVALALFLILQPALFGSRVSL